jgi:hypothetical protein
MTLYFFDTRDGDEFIDDDVGIDYPDLVTVKLEAARTLADLARDVIPGKVNRELAVEIRDAQGPVLIVKITFEAIVLRAE